MDNLCWLCSKEHGVNEGEIGKCRNCGADVDTTVYKPVTEEEEMPFEKAEKNYLSLPKIGQEYDFSQHGAVTEIKKVEGGKGFNFKKKETLTLPDGKTATVDKDLGFHYAISFEDGKVLTVSSWQPYYAMDKAGLIEGQKFLLKHPEKGSWEVIIK